jgi:hypothetical protein
LAAPGSRTRTASLAQAVLGLVLVLVGAVTLGGLFVMSNSRAPALENAMISLGLAGSVLISATAQALLVVGLWLLWRIGRRRRS